MKFTDLIGPHPAAPHPLGVHLTASDELTDEGVPHRMLGNLDGQGDGFVAAMKGWVISHHSSPEMRERDRRRREAMDRLGFFDSQSRVGRFPKNPNTQKGNWAEILLAEYLGTTCGAKVPVYRLRYNPNVDQSMKGDDVLAFDLDSEPVRILIGEAKFRGEPSKQVVEEIVEALAKSYRAGLPVSLQFVADRLFEEGKSELAVRVERCNLLFALGKLRLDYVGLLVSDANTASHIRRSAKKGEHRLAVISLGLNNPGETVSSCYTGLEE